MAKTEDELRLDQAVAILIEGKKDTERMALDRMLRVSYNSFLQLATDAESTRKLDVQVRRERFLYQALASIAQCQITICDCLSAGLNENTIPRLGGVIAGLDRAISYVDGHAFIPRKYITEDEEHAEELTTTRPMIEKE